LFGRLCGLDEEVVQVETSMLGKLRLRRSHVRLIERGGKESGALFVGPPALRDWLWSRKGWTEEQGQVSTSQSGAALAGGFLLPTSVSIELEVSWQKKADFVLAFGVGESEQSAQDAFRLEAYEGNLILLRELKDKANVAFVQTIPTGEGSLHLQVLLDQEAG